MDRNGGRDAADASDILRIYAVLSTGGEVDLSDEQMSDADVNFDGIVDASDASDVLRYYAFVSTTTKIISFREFLETY